MISEETKKQINEAIKRPINISTIVKALLLLFIVPKPHQT